jgi:uncharacterized membrane protein
MSTKIRLASVLLTSAVNVALGAPLTDAEARAATAAGNEKCAGGLSLDGWIGRLYDARDPAAAPSG